jgi:hypothetical protein
MTASPKLYLRSYPELDGMEAHAAAEEEDGWDGMLLTDTQNLSMDVFGSMYSGPHVIDLGARLGDRLTVTVGAEPERVG